MRWKKSDEKTSTKHSSAVAVVEALFTFDTEVGDCAACTSCAEPKSFFSGKHFVCSHDCCRSATKSILFYYYFIVLLWHNYFYCKSETAVTVCVCTSVFSATNPPPEGLFRRSQQNKSLHNPPFRNNKHDKQNRLLAGLQASASCILRPQQYCRPKRKSGVIIVSSLRDSPSLSTRSRHTHTEWLPRRKRTLF